MSTSICSVKSGIVALDSAIRRAIVCCVRDSSTVVVSPFAVVTPSIRQRRGQARCRRGGRIDGGRATNGERGTGVGRPSVPGAASASNVAAAPASTSAFTIRPPGPLPVRARRSMPLSRAIRLASGEALTRSADVAASLEAAAVAWVEAAGAASGAGGEPCVAVAPFGCWPLGSAAAAIAAPLAALVHRAPWRPHARSTRRPPASSPRPRRSRARRPGLTRRSSSPCRSRSRRAPRRGDLLAVALQPAQDRALLHRVRQARHHDVGHHVCPAGCAGA